jgi:CheY-like chemotaxis protein
MEREVSIPILVADDSDDDAVLLKLVMQQAGVLNPIIVARNGEEAITHLQELPAASGGNRLPRIVFLDVRMPGKDGLQVLKWIKEQPHLTHVLAVMLSHYGEIGTVKRAYDLGAYSFLSKPFLLRDLEHLIKYTRVCWTIAPKPRERVVKSENRTAEVPA